MKPTYQELAEIILEWHHRQAGDGAKWFDKMVEIAGRLESPQEEPDPAVLVWSGVPMGYPRVGKSVEMPDGTYTAVYIGGR